MARSWVHTVHKNGQWINELEGGQKLSGHRKKDTAVQAGRREAKKRETEHVIHNLDGKVGKNGRNSYGNDPRSSPG